MYEKKYKKYLVVAFIQSLSALSLLALNLIIAWYLPQELYGMYAIHFNIGILIGSIISWGFYQYLYREAYQLNFEGRDHQAFILLVQCVSLVVLTYLFFFLPVYYLFFKNIDFSFILYFSVIPVFILIFSQYLRAIKRFVVSQLTLVIFKFSLIILASSLIFLGFTNPIQNSFIIASIVSLIFIYWIISSELRKYSIFQILKKEITKVKIKKLIISAKNFQFINILQSFKSYTDGILLFLLSSSVDFATYSFSLIIISVLLFPGTVINNSRVRNLSKKINLKDIKGIKKEIVIFRFITIPLWFTLFALISLTGEKLLEFFYASKFTNSILIIQILLIGRLFHLWIGPILHILQLTKNEHYGVKIISKFLLINVIFSIILIPKFGLYGAAFTNAISFVLYSYFLNSWFNYYENSNKTMVDV